MSSAVNPGAPVQSLYVNINKPANSNYGTITADNEHGVAGSIRYSVPGTRQYLEGEGVPWWYQIAGVVTALSVVKHSADNATITVEAKGTGYTISPVLPPTPVNFSGASVKIVYEKVGAQITQTIEYYIDGELWQTTSAVISGGTFKYKG